MSDDLLDALIPITAPPSTLQTAALANASLASAVSASLASFGTTALPADGVHIVTQVDLDTKTALVGGLVQIRDWRGAVIASRSATGAWGIGGSLTWTFGDP